MKFLWVSAVSCLTFTNQDITRLYTGNYSVYCHLEYQDLWSRIDSNYTKVEIAANETEILSILEIRHFPSFKVIEQGKVYTFDGEVEESQVQAFQQNYKKSRYFNYLPTSYSIWSKFQLDFYLFMLDTQEKVAQGKLAYLRRVVAYVGSPIRNSGILGNLPNEIENFLSSILGGV